MPRPTLDGAGPRFDEAVRWLQGAIVAPHEGGRPVAPAEAAAWVRSSGDLAPAERVGVYAYAYFSRLRACLADEFPAVEALLGGDEFNDLCKAYLARYPSRSFTLGPLGWSLPRHLADVGDDAVPRRALVLDVARLETAMARVFAAPDEQPIDPAALAAVPPERWPDTRLRFIAALEVHAFDFPANAVVNAVRRDEPLPALEPHATWCAVYRSDLRVWRCDLPRARFVLLDALVAGATLGEAVERAVAAVDGADLGAEIQAWMADWVGDGLIAAVA